MNKFNYILEEEQDANKICSMSQIKTCYLRDDEGCDLESCTSCGYYKLIKEYEYDTQQLKNEIASYKEEIRAVRQNAADFEEIVPWE